MTIQHDKSSNNETANYDAPLEKVFDKIVTPFEEFIHRQTTSGLILLGCTIVALFVANSLLYDEYEHFLHSHFVIGVGEWKLDKSLHHWINDGLMVVFFFVVGLEIKREILVGELADAKHAVLPIVAAVGGMVVPALFYTAVNAGTDGVGGWGIPMATDIAFAVGIMVLLGSRVSKPLITFLVALAIVDDLGAVAVIALFYTESIAIGPLILAIVFLGVLIAFNLFGIRKPLPYFIVGAMLWLAMLKSGIHATIAGILTAWTIPARPKFEPVLFSNQVRALMGKFDKAHRPGESIMNNQEQRAVLQTLENVTHMVQTPLQRLEHGFHLPVALLVIPIFALANAGIPVEMSKLDDLFQHPVALGVILGLVLGKSIGIFGFSWLAIKLGFGQLPKGTQMKQLIGVGFLGGIGFTMSIFIADLAFINNAEYLLLAKTGILFASLLAGIIGLSWLFFLSPKPQTSQPPPEDVPG
ncbi:Na+/H+ antiporter NhaA [Kaarinaea lacus]